MSQPEPVPQLRSPENRLVAFAKEIYGIWVSELVVARQSVEEQSYVQQAGSLLGTEVPRALLGRSFSSAFSR